MNFIAAIGLDIAAAGIIFYCMRAAAKKGFVRTVIQMIAYVTILLAASFLSRAAAPVVYDRVVEPMIMENFQQDTPEDAPQNAALISVAPRGTLSFFEGSLGSIEDFIPEDFDPEAIAEDLIDDLADVTLRPLMISAIGMILFVALFALMSLVANIVLSALGVINYLPVVGTVNAILGGVVGILEGVLIVWMLGVLLQGVLHLYPEGWWIINQSAVDSSYFFRYFFNPDLLNQLYP